MRGEDNDESGGMGGGVVGTIEESDVSAEESGVKSASGWTETISRVYSYRHKVVMVR